jgi:hypothetical protein
MKIHYFQRYHSKENVSTGNTMLLFSRLYHYSSSKFHTFVKSLIGDEIQRFESGIIFDMQVKSTTSVPDGQIKQKSFNIVIETKLGKDFDIDQIRNHLNTFHREDYQIMLTLSPFPLPDNQRTEIMNAVDQENNTGNKNIKHIHTTFEKIMTLINDVIDYRDFEFNDILDDYREYCSHEGLLSNREHMMRAVTVGKTFDDNIKYKLYYDPAARGYSEHGYLGLYKDKAIRAVGRIVNIVEADEVNGQLMIKSTTSPLTSEQEQNILGAIISSRSYGWDVEKDHKFFCVDEFVETLYVKTSKYPLQSTKFFDLNEVLGLKIEKSSQGIAKLLYQKPWE